MNIHNYDYYGNYKNNDESPLFSVNEIQKKAKERENNRHKIYYKISKKCFEKIKETSENDLTYCFFKVPEYIPGFPLFNMTQCVLYLLNILKEKGFHSRYVDGYMLYISWSLPKQEYKSIENIPQVPKKNALENIHLKYKPIESNHFKNFIPRKKY
jgi:hypothetical protein